MLDRLNYMKADPEEYRYIPVGRAKAIQEATGRITRVRVRSNISTVRASIVRTKVLNNIFQLI